MVEIILLASVTLNITLAIAYFFLNSSYKDEKEKEIILLKRVNDTLQEKDAAIETALQCISDTSKNFNEFINSNKE